MREGDVRLWQWNDSFYTTTYLTSSKVMTTQLSSLSYNLAIQLCLCSVILSKVLNVQAL